MNETLGTLTVAWLALTAAAISPGPNMVAVASRGMGAGAVSAISVALGIALGGFIWALMISAGLGAIFQEFPLLLNGLGILGGGYLFWLGVKGWRSAFMSSSRQITHSRQSGILKDIRHGLMVTATNPKVVLLWMSLSTFVGNAITSLSTLFLFSTISSLILFLIYGGYGVLFSLGGVRGLYIKFQRASDAAFGTIFCALGIAMILRSLSIVF